MSATISAPSAAASGDATANKGASVLSLDLRTNHSRFALVGLSRGFRIGNILHIAKSAADPLASRSRRAP